MKDYSLLEEPLVNKSLRYDEAVKEIKGTMECYKLLNMDIAVGLEMALKIIDKHFVLPK